MTSGIYCFKNKVNGKRYIGQSGDIDRRILDHLRALSRGKDNCVLLQHAHDKYGMMVFEISILEECAPSSLDDLEEYYISIFHTTNARFGYNISTGGSNGLLGHKKSDETRKRMSVANTKEKHPMWGKHHKDDTKQKMKNSHSGANNYQFGKKKPNSASSYLGVYKFISKGRVYWGSGIKVHGKHVYIGASKDEVEVAKMYDKYIIEHGLPNPLNFP